jgi:peptide chain release factor subunit 1
MHADRFRALLDTTGPFVSVYFDDSHDTADAGAQLDARLRDIRKHLEEQSVHHSLIEAIDAAVRAKHPPVGRSGRYMIAAGDRIVFDEHLARPPAGTQLRVSDQPYLVPVVEHGISHTSYLLVAVDHTGADITVHDGQSRTETVEGSGHPVHKAHKADTAGYGGPQGRVDEAVRKNLREVADRITRLVDETGAGVVFITGDARTELAAELPERVADKAVGVQGGGRAAGTDEAELQRGIGEELLKLRLAALDDAAQRFAAGHGAGLAVEGLAAVTAALRDGSVDILIIGDLGDQTVIDEEGLRRADEALPLLAVATGAAMVRTDSRLTPADGIAAVLRYADPNVG